MHLFLFLLSCISLLGFSHSHGNVTVSSPTGRICTYDPVSKLGNCQDTDAFIQRIKGLIALTKDSLQKALSKNLRKPQVGYYMGGAVCPDIDPYLPSFCSCAESSTGGQITCSYTPTVDGVALDTFTMVLDLAVCANPASMTITLKDKDTGLSFTYTINLEDSGSVPTGLEIGIPDIGNAEILLTYSLSGNLDSLTIELGIDFQVCVVGVCKTCSDYFPSECPVEFIKETIDFSNDCN